MSSCRQIKGYETESVRLAKEKRLAVVVLKKTKVQVTYDRGQESICRGGRQLAAKRRCLEQANLTAEEWRAQ